MSQEVLAMIMCILVSITTTVSVKMYQEGDDFLAVSEAIDSATESLYVSLDTSLTNQSAIDIAAIEKQVYIDKATLLSNFNYFLLNAVPTPKAYDEAVKGIKLYMLIYPDRVEYSIDGQSWQPPRYFTTYAAGKEYYLCADDKAKYDYYEYIGAAKVYHTIVANGVVGIDQTNTIGLSKYDKNKRIFEVINEVVNGVTNEFTDSVKNSLSLEFFNRYEPDPKAFYNSHPKGRIKGTTFLVVFDSAKYYFTMEKGGFVRTSSVGSSYVSY